MTDADEPEWPGADAEAPPEHALYSLNQITLAAFLGSPLPGLWLASRNFDALGRREMSAAALMWGVGLTAANLVLAFIVPEAVPGLVVSLPFILGTRWMAKNWLGPELEAHESAGGPRGSWGVAVLAGVVGMVVALVVIFGIAVLLTG